MHRPYDFTCGLFASASHRVKNFGFSMYEASLFQQSIEAQIKLEDELNLAIKNGEDTDIIETKQREIDYLGCLFELSLSLSVDDKLH